MLCRNINLPGIYSDEGNGQHINGYATYELKVGGFAPEHVGKMQFYLAVLDDTVRLEGEKPSIGSIICRKKRHTIVEYALKDANKPISVSSYHVVKELPQELVKELPSPQQM